MSESTTRRVAEGAGFIYSYRLVERLLDAGSIVILARILTPDAFGLVAVAASFAAIIEGLSAFDVNKALIRTRDDDHALYDTAWTLSVLRGLVSAVIMLSIAPFLSDERLSAALAVLALSPIVSGLANPRFVMFERELIYSKLAVLTLGAKLVSVTVTLGLALVYRSFWALIAGILAATLVSTALSYVLRPYRPTLSLARFSDIFGFSGWLSLTTMVTTVSMETDKLIVGRLLGVANAGRYFMTQRVGVLPTRELIGPLQRILFPSFASLASETERLKRVVAESVNVVGSLSLPAGVGFALVANDFVPLVLGEQWIEIVPLLVILVPYLGVRATLSMTLPVVMALGKTRLLFWVSFAYALVHLPAFVAATYAFGLKGSIWSIVGAGILYIGLNAWLLRRTLGLTVIDVGSQLRRPAVAAAIMTVAIITLEAATPWVSFSLALDGSWSSLTLKVFVGALVFVSAQLALWRVEGRPAGVETRLLQLRG